MSRLTQRQEKRFHDRALKVLKGFLPAEYDFGENPLPEEIAKRIVDNAKIVSDRLRDQVLIILADYRDHSWTRGALKREGVRIEIANLIMGDAP